MTLATIKHIFLYPVKSMRGVEVNEAYLGLNGFFGDRRYAFVQEQVAGTETDAFPWLTGRQKPAMLLHHPRYLRSPTGDDPNVPVLVQTPDGAEWDVADPRLCDHLARLHGQPVFLLRNSRGNFDSQHVGMFSLKTLAQLETESASHIDLRQFRANLYLEPTEPTPFVEDTWVGRVLQVGESARLGVTKKDMRCMMINLAPDTAIQNPAVLRTVVQRHDECAGIYGNVIATGNVRVGDTISLA